MAMSAGAARRSKPKIRPPRNPQPGTSIKETWSKLSAAIREIQNHNASKLSYEEHYRYAYNMVLYKPVSTTIEPSPNVYPFFHARGNDANNLPLHPFFGRQKDGDDLYNGFKALVSEHLDKLAEDRIVPTFPRSGGTHGAGKLGGGAEAIERATEGDRFLKAIKGVWDDHSSSMRKLKDILKYMNKVYTASAGVPLVEDVGLTLFLTHIIRSPKHPIHTHLISTLLSQVQLERDGETIQRSTVRECVDILLRLTTNEREGGKTVYVADFEGEFLRRSGEFYRIEGLTVLETGDAALYLRNVEKRLAEEAERTAHYLSTATSPALQALLVDSLLTPHLQAVLDMPGTGLAAMLDADRISDLRRMYTIFLRVPSTKGKMALRLALRENVESRGKAINVGASGRDEAGPSAGPGANGDAEERQGGTDADDDPKGKGKAKAPAGGAGSGPAATSALFSALRWVQDVLDLKDKFDTILDQAFAGDKQVQTSINEAFQSFINANPRAPEYLSLFIDEHLKRGTKAKSEDEIELALEKTIVVFRFLADKDKFERYYKNHLAKRLLYARSASDDAERGMVAKLKVEMGFQFTQKLEGMFTDMKISEESGSSFRNHLNRHGQIPFDLSVNVLTASYWPPQIVTTMPCTFGPQLTVATAAYQKFYDQRHSGRRLTWQASLGTADVRVRFKSRSHDLNVSTYALVVLLLFEDAKSDDTLSYSAIQAATGMPDGELQRTLQSLACAKFRVLTKIPKGRDVNPTDEFAFNESFTSPLARIKIMQVASRVESAKEREETQERVDEERKHQIEACIVRVMKDRKTMSHNDLISEVAHQLSSRFSPSLSVIKKRIEGLIDREYLERTSDIGMYRYLA